MEPPLSLLTYSWCYQVSNKDLQLAFKAVTAPDIAESDHRGIEIGKLEAKKAKHEAAKAWAGTAKAWAGAAKAWAGAAKAWAGAAKAWAGTVKAWAGTAKAWQEPLSSLGKRASTFVWIALIFPLVHSLSADQKATVIGVFEALSA